MRPRRRALGLGAVAALLAVPRPVAAHAFGQTYQLPVPFWLVLFGAAATIVASFLLMGLLLDRPPATRGQERVARLRPGARRAWPPVRLALRAVSVALLLFTIYAGLAGVALPEENWAPTFFWIVFLLGMTYLSGLVANVWPILDPFRAIAMVPWRLLGKTPLAAYPRGLGYSPAWTLLLFLFAFELLSGSAATYPPTLAVVLAAYTVLTIVGVLAVGPPIWFRYCDPFSVMFRLLGHLAPLAPREDGVAVRRPLVGADRTPPVHLGLVAFILLMLAATAYDGLTGTRTGFALQERLAGRVGPVAAAWGLYLATFAAFAAAYALTHAASWAAHLERDRVGVLVRRYAFSLLPIALGYSLAHYVTLLLVQGQFIVALASDPLGRGWDLFGTADVRPWLGFLTGAFVWYTQTAFILAGHVAGVYLAHVAALRAHPTPRAAMLSQVPMVALMVLYTLAGLWLLSQAGTAPE